MDASQQMATLSEKYGCGDAAQYAAEAIAVGNSIDLMQDPAGGPLWLAATLENAVPDVWGSMYTVALNLSTATLRQAAMDAIVGNKSAYFSAGQIRSLPAGTYWTRCFGGKKGGYPKSGCPANGTYQNGAYWATPMAYFVDAMLATGHANFANEVVGECIDDFKAHGIYEDVDYGSPATSRGVLNYTASATNVLRAAKKLDAAAAAAAAAEGGADSEQGSS